MLLSSGLVICRDCFWGENLPTKWLNDRFGGVVSGNGHGHRGRKLAS